MHIYFCGIGGTAIGPLALIAKQAGYDVSGSDKQHSQYLDYLKQKGIENIHVDQSYENIKKVHDEHPIDWLVYTSAAIIENPEHPEINFAKENGIRTSKRDELINKIIIDSGQRIVAVAGTHGKTTTTAMLIWLFKQAGLNVSYSVGAKISFGDMGHFDPDSKYFVLEADEFDRNFLSFHPFLSVISGIGYDHHEIFPTKEEYFQAFKQFVGQSNMTILYESDDDILDSSSIVNSSLVVDDNDMVINQIKLPGLYNRKDARLAIEAVHRLINGDYSKLVTMINDFPGVSRRFEKIAENLYSDYAHTPEKILGVMSVAKESVKTDQKIVVIYEPLTNRRMHYTASDHKDIFSGASKIYWTPSYLAREDINQKILSPEELIPNLSSELQNIAEPAELNENLKNKISEHLSNGDMVLALSGGGGGSLDEWLRINFTS